ncbi:pyridoxal phosphate-dependent aminotransferase [Persicobacter psychrovividus]|uniref:Aminotransferase n=1 Tax=Persicobacter psychrovividus TaxID=387638 RepID=A0ABM7VLD6_9BACT|nr:aminotransferase [Persicobacter psychrovividus]
MFDHQDIDFKFLKKYAYNYRWATVPETCIPLTAADPDFPFATEIQSELQNYLAHAYMPYGRPEGVPEFLQALTMWAKKRGMNYTPDQILPTNSAAEGLNMVIKKLISPGDEVICPDPVDFLFFETIANAGGKVVTFSAFAPLDYEVLASKVTAKTKAIMICHPHNPMGQLYQKADLELISKFAVDHQLKIISDEIWSDIIYDDQTFTPFASLNASTNAITYTVYGLSKGYALAGFRIGVVFCPTPEDKTGLMVVGNYHSTIGGCPPIAQLAGQFALEKATAWQKRFVEHLQEMRDLCFDAISANDYLEIEHKPAATYLLFPKIINTNNQESALTEFLLEEHQLAVVPGNSRFFGEGAQGHIRLCYSTSKEILTQAMERLNVGMAAWAKLHR